jgi:hypothetical protein
MGLIEDVSELKEWIKRQEAIDNNKAEKKFKFPFGVRVRGNQRKKNYVTVLIINENSSFYFKKYQIEEQTITHDAILRLAASGHVIYDKKGNPMIILPSWSVEPFSPLNHYSESLINGSNKKGYAILMAKMMKDIVKPKVGLGGMGKWIAIGFGAIIIGVIIYAFMSGGGA